MPHRGYNYTYSLWLTHVCEVCMHNLKNDMYDRGSPFFWASRYSVLFWAIVSTLTLIVCHMCQT